MFFRSCCRARFRWLKSEAYKPIGIILSGGPSSVYDADAPDADPETAGARTCRRWASATVCTSSCITWVARCARRPSANTDTRKSRLKTVRRRCLRGCRRSIQVWMSHGDEALELPPGFHRTAVTSNALAAIANEERRIWAVQFHPEVHHTPLGPQLIKNFVFEICGARGRLDAGALYRDDCRADSREGGQGACDLRALGRRGFVGGGDAGAQGDRQPADLHLCEQRRAAQERIPKRAEEPARQAGAEYCCRGCERAVPDAACGRHRSRDEAQEDWRGVHRGL